jgi:pyruvate kinase
MSRIIATAEEYEFAAAPNRRDTVALTGSKSAVDTDTDAVASGAVETAREVGAGAIVVLSHSGRTARLVARRRPGVPIIALTDLDHVARQLSLVWGVETIVIESIERTEEIIGVIREKVLEWGYSGRIVLTAGIPTKERAATNTIHVVDV